MYKGMNIITNIGLGVKLTNSMSFGESIFSAGFIKKTIMVDLHVRFNRAYPPRNGHKKTLEHFRRQIIKAKTEALLGGARRPHLQARQPLGPPVSLCIAMSILHHLLGCIDAVL